MCFFISLIFKLYYDLKDKEMSNRVNSKKDKYYIIDFYGDYISLPES